MRKTCNFVLISSILCILCCIGEFAVVFILAKYYPGYNHLKNTLSSLGASKSPVTFEMSSWWELMGIMMIVFGIGFRKAFSGKGNYTKFASWLIILYGFGEGIGSGAFKADRIVNGITFSGFTHDLLGGIGVTAILIFPLVMKKIITKNDNKLFFRISLPVFFISIILIIFFLFRYSPDESDFLSVYKGLWQRLFMLNIYFYMMWISFIMIKKSKLQQKNL